MEANELRIGNVITILGPVSTIFPRKEYTWKVISITDCDITIEDKEGKKYSTSFDNEGAIKPIPLIAPFKVTVPAVLFTVSALTFKFPDPFKVKC